MISYSELVWFSPRYAINYLWDLIQLKGEKVVEGGKYKKEQEAWIMGVALLGIMKLTDEQWWLQIPRDDPPDLCVMTMIPDELRQKNVQHYRQIEIMQITHFTNASIANEIMKKMKYKFYHSLTGLVVYLNRDTHIKDVRAIAEELKDKIKIADIWIITCTIFETNEYMLFSLHPNIQAVKYLVEEEMVKISKGDTLELVEEEGTRMDFVPNQERHQFIP